MHADARGTHCLRSDSGVVGKALLAGVAVGRADQAAVGHDESPVIGGSGYHASGFALFAFLVIARWGREGDWGRPDPDGAGNLGAGPKAGGEDQGQFHFRLKSMVRAGLPAGRRNPSNPLEQTGM
jgi:hypothetical protein